LQLMVSEIEALGATLLAISPQIPDQSLQTAEQNKLTFTVLSDAGNKLARQFGLVFRLPERLWQLYKTFGADVAAANGDENYELPIAATYVIGVDSVIQHAFVDTDYTKRLEPEEVITVLKKIAGRGE
jgi:peroxiredoxin